VGEKSNRESELRRKEKQEKAQKGERYNKLLLKHR
jgi:hypothetical protein